jgi:hypothetical protein
VAKVKSGGHDIDKTQVDPTNQEIIRLEGRLAQATRDNAWLKKRIKTVQQQGADFDALIDAVEPMIAALKPPKLGGRRKTSGKTQEDVGLILSDGHWDSIITPESVNGLEDFNPQVMLARAEHLVTTLKEWCFDDLKMHDFGTCHVFGLGDFINGIIHKANHYSAFHNACQSAIMAGELIAQIMGDLAHEFPCVKGYFVPGNHGRLDAHLKKNFMEPQNSFDYLAARVAKIACRSYENIEFAIPNSFTTIVNVRGWNYELSHGDDVISHSGTPYYGLDRKTQRIVNLSNVTGQKVDVVMQGHFHQAGYQPNKVPRLFLNGAFVATDQFAKNAMHAYIDPMQWAFGIHDKYSVSWPLPIYLKGGGDKRENRYTVEDIA